MSDRGINDCWLDERLPRLYDWYDEYYDDLGFWDSLCNECEGPFLDLGCGTGRIAIHLARSGHKVAGLDLSPRMIERAGEKLALESEDVRKRVSLHVGDMTDFDMGAQYPTVIIPCFSFNELTTPTAQRSCLLSIRNHLQDNGLLALATGLWMPDACTNPPEEPSDLGPPLEEGLNPHTGMHTRMWSVRWCDPATQTKYHRFYFEERDVHGELKGRFAVPSAPEWHARRLLTSAEAERFLRSSGFVVERTYGDWDMCDIGPDSRMMVIVARKAV